MNLSQAEQLQDLADIRVNSINTDITLGNDKRKTNEKTQWVNGQRQPAGAANVHISKCKNQDKQFFCKASNLDMKT